MRFNVGEHGAVPGDSDSLHAAWEQIRVACRALPAGTPSAVYFPPGVWSTDRTLWLDWDHATVCGDSAADSVLIGNPGTSLPLLIGHDRAPGGLPFPADRRPAMDGVMDGSMAGGFGYRLGQTDSDSYFLAASGTLADLGQAQWGGYHGSSGVVREGVRQLTIEVAFAYHGDLPEGVQLCGMMDRFTVAPFERWCRGAVRPWSLWFGEWHRFGTPKPANPQVVLSLATTDGPEPAAEKGYWPNFGESRDFVIDLGPHGPDRPIRLTVQVDLAAAKVTAFVDGVQVAVSPGRLADTASGWKPESDLRFVRNEIWPFKVGADGRDIVDAGTRDMRADFTVYGLSVTPALRYRDGGVDSPMVRTDTGTPPPSDAWRYTDDGLSDRTAPALWHLDLGVVPGCDGRIAIIRTGRYATAQVQRSNQTALLVGGPRSVGYPRHTDVTVRDLTVRSLFSGYWDGGGAAVAASGVLGLTIRRAVLWGGSYGFQTLGRDCIYPALFEEISTRGEIAGMFLLRLRAEINRLDLGLPGVYGLLVHGCDLAIEHVTCAGWNNRYGHALIKRYPCAWGGTLSLVDIWDDTEGGDFPSEGMIVCERGDGVSPMSLRIDGLSTGFVGPGAPIVALRDRAETNPEILGKVSIRGVTCYGLQAGGVVRADGPHWVGTVAEPALPTESVPVVGSVITYSDRFGTGRPPRVRLAD